MKQSLDVHQGLEMRTKMEFKTNISKENYLKWINEQPHSTFLQMPAWKEAGEHLKECEGYYVGIESQGQLIAAGLLLVYRDSKLTMAYMPKGPILDYRHNELVVFFIESLKDFVRELKIDFLRVEPPIVYQKWFQTKEVIETSELDLVALFEQHKFKHSGFFSGYHVAQPRYTFTIDLTKPYEQIVKNYDQPIRKAIERNELFQFEVIVTNKPSFDDFMRLREQLSTSKQFHLKPVSYFETLYNGLVESGHMRYYEISVDLDQLKINLEQAISKCDETIEILKEKQTRKSGKLINDQIQLKQALKEMLEQLVKYNHHGHEIVGFTMCSVIKDEMLAIYSHTERALSRFKISNILYDAKFKDAQAIGMKTFDFFGIPGIVNRDDEYYGLFLSKKNYGSDMVEFFGYFDYVVHPIKYRVIQSLRQMKLNRSKKRG